ncbi:MAG: hypothetical protein JWP57_1730, partial [Spirosoma sp.]|nr:hypothetical protein [Spirosoma sp.]
MILLLMPVYFSAVVNQVIYYGIGFVLVTAIFLYIYSAMTFLEKRKRQLFKENKISSKKITLQLRQTSVKKKRHNV